MIKVEGHSPDQSEVVSRARAAFLGMAIGDALGATTEFMTPNEINVHIGIHKKIRGGGWLRLKPGQVTDDTEMSLCIARALLRVGTWSREEIAKEFALWLKGKPVDVGATCRRGIRDYMLTGQLETPYNEWDAGNGAAMRMAPVALFSLGDRALLERCALEQAHLTHHHVLSDAACVTVGRMVQEAILGADQFRLHEITRELTSEFPTFRFNRYRGQASAYVVETLQTVFHHLFTTAEFEECLVAVVNQGGDADTTGAIAGAIAGAFYGESGLPASWLRKLDSTVRQEVNEFAEKLIALSPWSRCLQPEQRLFKD